MAIFFSKIAKIKTDKKSYSKYFFFKQNQIPNY